MATDLSFNGRPVVYWLRTRLSGDDEARWEAIDAIRHICTPDDSIPLFLDTLQNDSYWGARALAAHALYDLAFDTSEMPRLISAKPHFLAALNDSSADVREQIRELLTLLEDYERNA